MIDKLILLLEAVKIVFELSSKPKIIPADKAKEMSLNRIKKSEEEYLSDKVRRISAQVREQIKLGNDELSLQEYLRYTGIDGAELNPYYKDAIKVFLDKGYKIREYRNKDTGLVVNVFLTWE